MSSYHVVFTGTVIYETMDYREIDEEEECMVKRNEFKKRSRYLAMLTALSLAFSNIGSCVNMVYAAEAESQENGSEEEQEAMIRERIRESLKREKTLVKTAAKTVLGKINPKKINPKKIRMKTDPGMKAADSLVLKKQIVLKAARVQ